MKMIDDAGLTDDPKAAHEADKRLAVRFTVEKRLNHAAMNRVAEINASLEETAVLLDHAHKFDEAKAKRAEKLSDEPIYRNVEFVSIRIPGDNTLTIHRPVMASDKARFRTQYESFKNANGEALEGTSISSLPGIKDSTIRDLNYVGITTIEQLAQVPDSSPLASLMGGSALKQQAAAWVARNRKSSLVNQTNEALAERDNKIAELETKLNQLLAAQSEPTKPAKAASK